MQYSPTSMGGSIVHSIEIDAAGVEIIIDINDFAGVEMADPQP